MSHAKGAIIRLMLLHRLLSGAHLQVLPVSHLGLVLSLLALQPLRLGDYEHLCRGEGVRG